MTARDEPEKINILMVDDQPGKLMSYEVILAELGENLLKAGSAREALEYLLKTEVAVLLVDVCMPELDGFELAAMVREHPRFEKTAIIFVSAIQITDLDRLRGYAAGAVDYVPVPVVPEVLRAKVKVFGELYRKTRQLEQLNAQLESRVAERTAALEASALQLQKLNESLERRIDERTREREHALAQLFEAQKLDTIGQLTGGVAHDFNNLLMAVLGSLEMLEKYVPNEVRPRRLLQNARDGAQRGAALTQRLLAFARRQELKPEIVNLAVLIHGMEGLLARAMTPGIRIEHRIESKLPAVSVDANQLELALLNLAVNARDAMPDGGVLTIEASQGDDAFDGIPGPAADQPSPQFIRLSLRDTGAGMDPGTLAKATEPFFTTKGLGKGTGLGLSMVHGLAVQSGGAMKISSEPGRGTRVDLWLPQAAGAELPPNVKGDRTELRRDVPKTSPRRILVVDDDPLVRIGTVAMLEELGHVAVEAESGNQALTLVDNGPAFDIVITDHAMPGMTGLELAAALRARCLDLPVILATGYAELPTSSLEHFTLPRLSKPYSQADLSVSIAEVAGPGLMQIEKVNST